jgi:hypothetical protein
MTSSPEISDHPSETPSLLGLSDDDRARLGEVLQELMAHGSIIGLESGKSALYHWARQYFDWVKESAALIGLDVALMHEERMIQAIPRTAALQIRLKQDATLVWLALWYAGDVRWRDEGQSEAFLTVAELNGLIKDQLLPDATGLFPRNRMREILRQAARFHLIRFELSDPFEESGIEILPAIRRVVPFRDLNAWTEASAQFQKSEVSLEETASNGEEEA